MKYKIRQMKESEYPLLEEFLYEAIFQKDESKLLPKSVIKNPDIYIYIEDFGSKKDDYCLCAEVDGKLVGAVWVRNIDAYGSIDDFTPEFAISLYKEYRGQRIGTNLMEAMLKYLKEQGYPKTSLSVQKDNYALKMYKAVGFEIISENEEDYIMVNILNKG